MPKRKQNKEMSKADLPGVSNNDVTAGRAPSKRRRNTTDSNNDLTNDETPTRSHPSPHSSPACKRSRSASARPSADVTQQSHNRINTNVGPTYKFAQLSDDLDLVDSKPHSRGTRHESLSKDDGVDAPRPPTIFRVVSIQDRTYPRRGNVKSIPHHCPSIEKSSSSSKPYFYSENINEAIYSKPSLERRLREANYRAFPGPSGAELRSTSDPPPFNAVLTYINWPKRDFKSREGNNGTMFLGYSDGKIPITTLQAIDQQRIFLVAHNMATTARDVQTMCAYYDIHFDSLKRILCTIELSEMDMRELRQWERKTSKIAMARHSAFEKGHITAEELRNWITHSDAKHVRNESTKIQGVKGIRRQRIDKRTLLDVLGRWHDSWVSMGGLPMKSIPRLKKNLQTRTPRWAAEPRGWTGITPEDVTEETFPFVRIDKTVRKLRGPEHDRGTCGLCKPGGFKP